MNLKDKPAFARPCGQNERMGSNSQTGMTLREYYAGLALQGMLANQFFYAWERSVITKSACQMADALIAELEKE